jgi:hypothetical protein
MLTFNETLHEYRFNNEIVPSVTQIISDLNDLSSISEHVLKNKGELGTEFHRIIKLHFLDDLVYDTIDSRLVPAFNTFLDWSKPRLDEFKKALSEYKMFDQKLWLAGTLDLALQGDLFDWKLRFYNPVVDILQLDGYDTILGGGKRKRWTMCFDMRSGKLSQRRSEHSQSHTMFMYMLKHFHSDKKDMAIYNNTLEFWKGEFN